MYRFARVHYLWLAVMLAWSASGMAAASDIAVERLATGDVLLLRHALAPGFGDPEKFRVADCSTQRNLSDEGRQQARTIGAWLRARGIKQARIYSSQWCRCLETAELLGIGKVVPLPGLNSFYQRPADREPNLAALPFFLASQQSSSEPLVLVTHQVTIAALADIFPDSGEGVIATQGENGELRNFARLSFGR